MTYSEVVNWLFNQLPNYQNQGGTAYKPGLEVVSDLLDAIGNPEKSIKTVHIAGTNGKGSVSHILSALFQENGYKTGLFTSPHISDFRERIKINGVLIDEDFIVNFYQRYLPTLEKIKPTFFEITTAMAFKAFADNACDIAIIETGLGGRLDSTNVLLPEVSVITNVAKDHEAFLGDTLEKIAFEKAGIIKPNTPVVIGDLKEELYPVFNEVAGSLNANVAYSLKMATKPFKTDLIGQYQQRNIQTALSTVNVLRDKGWNLDEVKINEALKNIADLTNLRGRLQKIDSEPMTLVDAAHNPAGMKSTLEEIRSFSYNQLHIIYGGSNDKDLNGIFDLFPKKASYYFSTFESKRTAKRETFSDLAKKNNLSFFLFDDPEKALNACKREAGKDDLILICGSFYLLEKII